MLGTVFAGSMPLNNPRYKKYFNSFDQNINLDFNPKEFKFGIESIQEGEFATIALDEEGYNHEIGKAKLPIIRRLVEIPQSAEAEITLDKVTWDQTSLNDLNLPSLVVPCQFSVEKIPNPQNDFIIDENYYQTDSFLPEQIVKIVDSGEIRGRSFVLIELSPIQYNPSTGQLKLMNSCNIRIDLQNSDMGKTEEKIIRYSTPRYEGFFEAAFENYGMYEEGLIPRNQEGYLIIVYDNFFEEIQPLVSQKISMGYDVTTTKTSDIPGGPTKDNIYSYIEDAYDTWSIPPAYVLLVGDTPQIPTYTGIDSYSEADLYYVTVDGSDYFPDIYIGRFSGSTETDIESMVEKTVYYEVGGFSSFDWIKKAAFIASSDHGQLAEQTHNYVIDNYLNPNGYTCDKIYEASGGSTSDITNALNDGRSLCIYSGHGYSGGWACVPFDQTDISNLVNDGMYPLVCSHACSTNTFADSECYGETWLRAEDKGAIAFWGASAGTLWDEDDIIERAMFQSWWEDGLDWVGGMTDMALIYLYENYSGGGYTQYYFEAYNIIGDPSVRIWSDNPSDPPETPSKPNGPTSWIKDVLATFTSSTTDPDGDQIYYLFDWGDGQTSDWLGPYTSGQSAEAEHSWNELGDYEIMVMAKDIYNAQSSWSDALTITIIEDEPPGIPDIAGSKIIVAGREYKFAFTSTDPEGHDVYYKVDWDDGEGTDWQGPYRSGESMVLDHAWTTKGEYFIKAWAKDIYEMKSSQGWLKINVMKSKTRNLNLLNLLTRFIESRPIISILLNLR